jgi:hypothetical protein
VGGNISLPLDDARAFLKVIAEALERGGIVFQLELNLDEGDETVEHPRFREVVAGTRRSPGSTVARRTSDAHTVDRGRITVGERLRSRTADEVRMGWIASAPSERLLLTLTTKHAEPYERILSRLALAFDGIAALEYVGAPDPGVPHTDVLVERLPTGQPASPTLAEPALVRLGIDVARVVAPVHAAGQVIDGIRPELIYVNADDGEPRFSGLVPRGPAFIASAPISRGVRSYPVPYLSPEQYLSNQSGPASDVFALCATLFFLGSGAHPFGDPDQIVDLLNRLSTGGVSPWPGSPALGAVLVRGMPPRIGERTTASTLADELSRLA